MPITTLVGLSFGVFPCLLFGFIMLLSLLMCEYIEEYVAKHLCAWKNRRRRGFRSVYRDIRDRRSSNNNNNNNREGPPFRARTSSTNERNTPPVSWSGEHPSGSLAALALYGETLPTAPPSNERQINNAYYGAQFNDSILAANDPPPSYEECFRPRTQQINSTNNSHGPSPSSSNDMKTDSAKKSSKSSKKSSKKLSSNVSMKKE